MSPLYLQYMEVQKNYPNSVIAYRLGDFYEIFAVNAVKISEILGLTLTSRDCGLTERIPMIGFPYHSADNYFKMILENGYTIAVYDNSDTVRCLPDNNEVIDKETGEILTHDNSNEIDYEIINAISDKLGDIFLVR